LSLRPCFNFATWKFVIGNLLQVSKPIQHLTSYKFINCKLLGFLVRRVLPAGVAELAQLETTGGALLVLGRGVVPVLAIRALESDDIPHLSMS
jgi:hypothetical protein